MYFKMKETKEEYNLKQYKKDLIKAFWIGMLVCPTLIKRDIEKKK